MSLLCSRESEVDVRRRGVRRTCLVPSELVPLRRRLLAPGRGAAAERASSSSSISAMKQFLRVKQLADQTFSRSGKGETLTDELAAADRKAEQVKASLQILSKRLGPGNSSVAQGQDPAAREKRLKKIPEYLLGLSMQEANNFEEDSLLKYILLECGKTEINLANEVAEHDLKVEQLVCSPLNSVIDQDIPNIVKAKKQLNRLLNERDSAATRYHNSLRQSDRVSQDTHKFTLDQQKTAQAREEAEDAEIKADQARDALASEMFAFLSKEMHFSNTVLQYLKLQRAYHESALHVLTDVIPHLEKHINDSTVKPVFGFPIEEHLRVTGRTIAFPIELCVCALHESGLSEEGLFRIAAGSSRMKRMKLSLDSGIFSKPLSQEYRDVHVIAGVLKSYLRELPEPLLTHRLHDSFLSAITKNPTEEARLNSLWEVIHQLPEPNFSNLRYLIKFLSILTKNQAMNKMTPSNIAIVIAPNLLWNADDGSGIGFNMSNATTVNCVVELLVKHADWFFKDDINFFITITKEELLPDPDYGKGIYNQSFSPHDHSNGDYHMSKSMHEYGASYSYNNQSQNLKPNPVTANNKQSHSRSNSHDTSLILVDNEIKRTQSNSSLSDHSSPPQGSPKPIMRRKNKPAAPVPPNFVPPDKKESPKMDNASNAKDVKNNLGKNENDKPEKPPRPVVPEPIKHVAGVQTINRSTYKSKQINRGKKLSSSRENLADTTFQERRKSFESELESHTKDEISQTDISAIASTHSNTNNSVKAEVSNSSENPNNPVSVKSSYTAKRVVQPSPDSNSNQVPKVMPVAAPRTTIILPTKVDSSTFIEMESACEVHMRTKPVLEVTNSAPTSGAKPAIPERPAIIRPPSFRNSFNKNQSLEMLANINEINQNGTTTSGDTILERTHMYTVDKQQPTFIQVTGNPQNSDSVSPNIDDVKPNVQLTQSTGPSATTNMPSPTDSQSDQKILTSQMRKMSQSEGNILDVPPSPRLYHKPPRPQIPAPPPPTSRNSTEIIESTNL